MHRLLGMKNNDPRFSTFVLFCDEVKFSREGIFNVLNQHVCSDSNPQCTTPREQQQQISMIVWAGVLDDLVSFCVLPDRLTGATHCIFLEQVLSSLLQAVPLSIQRDMWFMHDGAPANFSIMVRNFSNATYPIR